LDFAEHEKSHSIPIKGGLLGELTEDRKTQELKKGGSDLKTKLSILKEAEGGVKNASFLCTFPSVIIDPQRHLSLQIRRCNS